MNHEIQKIYRSIRRRVNDPTNNGMSIAKMSWYYLLRKMSDLTREKVLIEVPFETTNPESAPGRIAVIIHCYYPELIHELLDHVVLIPYPFSLFVSTDTIEKRNFIVEALKARQIATYEVRLVDNRGRDIAPKYITFRDVYAKCDYFVHLHSKKSLHSGKETGNRWRMQLLHSLLGSSHIIASILTILKDPRIGLVFPDPFDPTIPSLRWGNNYRVSITLASRLGIKLCKKYCPEYPSGSMFWARASIVSPILDLNLRFDEFPPETGQLDGELQHALERMIVPITSLQGLYGLRIATRNSARRHKALRIDSGKELLDTISQIIKNDGFVSTAK